MPFYVRKTSGLLCDWNPGNAVNVGSPPRQAGRIAANLVWRRLGWVVFAGFRPGTESLNLI